LVWELNYRGELTFMKQAIAQKESKNLHVEDGWKYFIHGWTQVISEVFHINISQDKLRKLSEIAETTNN
jgi:shikimate dehydrogenase